jgi:hypothetical protein
VPQIAKALRADDEAVRYGLHVLRDEKIVRVTGTRMKATWSMAGWRLLERPLRRYLLAGCATLLGMRPP